MTRTLACGCSATGDATGTSGTSPISISPRKGDQLNLTERRRQKVYIANYYRQDFLTPGYNITASFHANIDKGEEFFFDANGFLVRPSPIGLISRMK